MREQTVSKHAWSWQVLCESSLPQVTIHIAVNTNECKG